MTTRLPDPPLQSGDVLLRPLRLSDAAAVAEAGQDLIPRFRFMKEGLTEAEARDWIEQSNDEWAQGQFRFAVVDRGRDRLLGQVGHVAVTTYKSAEASRPVPWLCSPIGRSTLSESSAFFLLTHVTNEALHAVPVHCGFSREGVLRAYESIRGGRPDMISWSLLPSDLRPWTDPL